MQAIDQRIEAKKRGEALSIGVVCNAVHLLERLMKGILFLIH